MLKEIKLPALGEKIESADVANILVHEGENIHKEDPLLELESEKAVMDFPSPIEGVVREIKIHSGEKIKIGQVLFVVDTEDPESMMTKESLPSLESGFTLQNGIMDSDLEIDLPEIKKIDHPENMPEISFQTEHNGSGHEKDTIGAAPIAHRLARELGVDIHDIQGSGANGFISKDDVIHHVREILRQGITGSVSGEVTEDLPASDIWGPARKEPLSSVRKSTAMTLSHSVKLIPHVTQQDRADITQLEDFRNAFNSREKNDATKISLTAILVKVCSMALTKFESMNASFDAKNDSIVYHDYRHIGVAVDTERGLFVPVIRDADNLGILEISEALRSLAQKARDKKLNTDEMKGATFTITNLGGFGTGFFTPLISWPQVAIMGTGMAAMEPVWDGKQFNPRMMLPISITYDHRLIDGAYAARFSRLVAKYLEEPVNMLI